MKIKLTRTENPCQLTRKGYKGNLLVLVTFHLQQGHTFSCRNSYSYSSQFPLTACGLSTYKILLLPTLKRQRRHQGKKMQKMRIEKVYKVRELQEQDGEGNKQPTPQNPQKEVCAQILGRVAIAPPSKHHCLGVLCSGCIFR